MGLTWIGMATPWFPDSISFLIILIARITMPIEIYILIGTTLLPILLLIWMAAFSELLYKDKQKKILMIFAIIAIIYELIFFVLFFLDAKAYIGEYQRYFQVEFKEFITLFDLALLVIVLITGIIFAKKSLSSLDEKIHLKGRFLLAAFISFCIGAALDASTGLIFTDLFGISNTNPFISIFVVIIRIILISSAFEFYIGFMLPKWVENLMIKSREE